MSEPSKPFSRPIDGVYLQHVFALAHTALTLCDEALAALPQVPETGYFITVNPLVHAKFEMVLTSAANIAKLLHIPAPRSKGKSSAAFEWRRRRAIYLNDVLGNPELPELRRTDGRNVVEHFDLFLDRVAMEGDPTHGGKYRLATYNVVLTSRSIFGPPARPLREYVVDEQLYTSLDESTNIGLLRTDLVTVLDRVRPHAAGDANGEPGGMVLVFPRD